MTSREMFAMGKLRNAVRHIEQGWSPSCESHAAEANEWGVLKVGCVNGGVFNADEQKALPARETPIPNLEVREGDILMSRANTRELLGSLALVPATRHRLLVCDKLFRFTLKSEILDPRFLVFAFQSADVRRQIEGAATGASSSMQNIGQDTVQNLLLPLPPIGIQRAVARVLDRKTAAIDTLIAKKERLIKLLQEKRQALITLAVTKGLDPNVPMKDSEIPWIGSVPSTWKIVAIKRTAKPGRKTFTDGDWIESPFITEEGVRLVQTGNVGIGRYKEQGFRYISPHTFHELNCTEVSPRDVLICRLDGPVGRACLAPSLGMRMITSVDNAILKPHSECDARYLVYVLSSPKYLDWVQVLCRVGGGFRFRVSRSMLGDIQIPVPPLAEQKRIADLLDEQTERLSAIEQKLKLHCERLNEYRQALITAAVTGKIDVSKEAA